MYYQQCKIVNDLETDEETYFRCKRALLAIYDF